MLNFSGCGKFFPKMTGTGGGGTGTGTGDNFYVASGNGSGSVSGFSVGTSNMTNTPNSPYTLGVAPSSMAVTPSGSFVFVGTLAGAIYGYSVNGDGSLNLLGGGNSLVNGVSPNTIAVDPSGNWLIAADLTPAAYVFAIDSSTGGLTQQGNALPLAAGSSPSHIVFTPSGGLAYISLGTAGVGVFTFNASNGALGSTNKILLPKISQGADQGLAVDPGGKYLFVAETAVNALREFSIASTGALTELTGSPFKTGLGPTGVLVDSTGSYVYVTNRTDGTISAFSLTAATGALAKITGSPFATGLDPSDIAEDTAKTHIGVANTGGSPDFQVFTIGASGSTTPGGLTSFAKTTNNSGTPTGALAVVAAD